MWLFDQNNQQMYQQYANAWEQGTHGQLHEQEARQNYQQFVQYAPPQMVQQVHERYYEHLVLFLSRSELDSFAVRRRASCAENHRKALEK